MFHRIEPDFHHIFGRQSGGAKLSETVLFALTRALFIGGLGAAAVLVGAAVTGFQRGAWIVLGSANTVIGIL